jgi:hypothetical protein
MEETDSALLERDLLSTVSREVVENTLIERDALSPKGPRPISTDSDTSRAFNGGFDAPDPIKRTASAG